VSYAVGAADRPNVLTMTVRYGANAAVSPARE
jgi:hypothetical protein